MRVTTFWRLFIATLVEGLGVRSNAEHYVCLCVCDRVMVRSASKHCISSSEQVFKLCDPAKDYGCSGGIKMGLETHPSSLKTDCSELLCILVLQQREDPPPTHYGSNTTDHHRITLQLQKQLKRSSSVLNCI